MTVLRDTGEGVLFPTLDAVPDPRPLNTEQRGSFLDQTYRSVLLMVQDSHLLSGGPEAEIMWDATLRSFVHGIWAGTIVCAQAVCERTLASLVDSWYTLPPEPKGWRRWGLGQLIVHCRERALIPLTLLEPLQYVCDVRKPFGHWKAPMEEGSLTRVGYEAYLVGRHWEEAQEEYVAKAAVICAQTAIRVYFGNLLMQLPQREWAQ